ncbi:hypothetical protein [Actinomadura opuntiae]|uniref:hypothetical protein n=1 Tax=Actinomadura sp. OS1-43 TaxID=604315 RepID=UPI00255AD62B|nr:hypothetical protein [Actinomadura sp. OS1-43]MDL4817703.1 hypothetical protein [Actinomadura sp. OS1-43]
MLVVVFVLAGLAVLGSVVVLAMGRGGELTEAHPDHPPLPLGDGRHVTPRDVLALRLPRAFWGYQAPVADQAFRDLARALAERDARVAALERRLDDLRHGAPMAPEPERIGALHGLNDPHFPEQDAPPIRLRKDPERQKAEDEPETGKDGPWEIP